MSASPDRREYKRVKVAKIINSFTTKKLEELDKEWKKYEHSHVGYFKTTEGGWLDVVYIASIKVGKVPLFIQHLCHDSCLCWSYLGNIAEQGICVTPDK